VLSSWWCYSVVKVDRRIRWHYTTTILRLHIGARLTRYRNCKFHNGCRTISRHAVPPSAGPLLPLMLLRKVEISQNMHDCVFCLHCPSYYGLVLCFHPSVRAFMHAQWHHSPTSLPSTCSLYLCSVDLFLSMLSSLLAALCYTLYSYHWSFLS